MEVSVTEARALSREALQEDDQLAAECQGRSVAGVMTIIRMVFLRWAGVRSRKKCEWADESSQSIASCGNDWPNQL